MNYKQVLFITALTLLGQALIVALLIHQLVGNQMIHVERKVPDQRLLINRLNEINTQISQQNASLTLLRDILTQIKTTVSAEVDQLTARSNHKVSSIEQEQENKSNSEVLTDLPIDTKLDIGLVNEYMYFVDTIVSSGHVGVEVKADQLHLLSKMTDEDIRAVNDMLIKKAETGELHPDLLLQLIL